MPAIRPEPTMITGRRVVSVVIVSWNTKQLLLGCIESLLRHAGEFGLELIVVDNASSDGSADAIETLYPEIKLIRSRENLGFARGNNLGIVASRGDYVCLVNSDIEVHDDALQKMIAFLERHPEIGVLGARLRNADGSIQQSCWNFPDLKRSFAEAFGLHWLIPGNIHFTRLVDLSVQNPISVDVACGAFCVIRRTALDQVGLLDERFYFYGEDIDWCRRFWDAGWQVGYFPAGEVIHHGGASSARAPAKYQVQAVRARMQYWRKHYSSLAMPLFYASLICLHLFRLVGGMLAASLRPGESADYRYKATLNWHALKWLVTGVMPT